jgi:hypothetical protein
MLSKGGNMVAAGTYWNVSTGARVDIDKEGMLPGDGKTTYVKVPGIMMLLMAPILGLVFAVFLPFIGIAMTVKLIGKKLAETTENIAVGSVSFGWKPIEAYLVGRKKKKEPHVKKSADKDAHK